MKVTLFTQIADKSKLYYVAETQPDFRQVFEITDTTGLNLYDILTPKMVLIDNDSSVSIITLANKVVDLPQFKVKDVTTNTVFSISRISGGANTMLVTYDNKAMLTKRADVDSISLVCPEIGLESPDELESLTIPDYHYEQEDALMALLRK